MKIICIGRNYAAHAAELGNALPDNPVVFLKPESAILRNNDPFYLPDWSNDIHFECELVFRIGKQGKYVQPGFARSYIDGIGLGIDFTARDLQSELKAKGLPWELSKAFNGSAVIGNEFVSPDTYPDWKDIRFSLHVNGELRQSGHTALMLYDIETLIEFVSKYFTLKSGDLIYTGTPAGVGPVKPGDRLVGALMGKPMFDFEVK